MTKVVSLSVHKNTLEKRRQKELKKEAMASLKELLSECEPEAFVIAVIDKDQSLTSYTMPGSLRPAEFALLLRDGLSEQLMLSGNDEVTLTLEEADE